MSRNRLAEASSPYLRQHKDNPVHWQPWDEEAHAQAIREDKPIFLSVGYSSCHWCHVMEHETFENDEVAVLLNENFVSIKVDREERPDVDEAYMTAVQLYNGHGGWPMTLFLTPERNPFFAGTYLPAQDRGQHPGFLTVASYFAKGWKNHRSELEDAATEFRGALEHALSHETPESHASLDSGLIDAAISAYKSHGFGGKPRFPAHQIIHLLLHFSERPECVSLACSLLDEMMLGGIHDHVGGGFHRYSTDERWLLPHFEKMLYDNAQMLSNYATAFQITGNAEYRRVCERLVGWLEREMTSAEGLFFSALDADSEGEEGKYYTWSFDEAARIASREFAEAYGLRKEGNFRDEALGALTGQNIPHIAMSTPTRLAGSPTSLSRGEVDGYDRELELLLVARNGRVRPGLDDKALVAWNGLMISGLVAAGRPDLAEKCANAILKFHPIPHQVVNGMAEGRAFLDLAYFVEGLLDLGLRDKAEEVFDAMVPEFHDENGGWYFSGESHERLFGRTKTVFDNATPSAAAVMTRCAVRLGKSEIAGKDLAANLGWMERAPFATATLLRAAAEFLGAGYEVQKKEGVRSRSRSSPARLSSRMESPDGRLGSSCRMDGTFSRPAVVRWWTSSSRGYRSRRLRCRRET